MRYPRTLCSIQVNNPGGGSGSGTVTTDGVTIQGTGAVASPIAIKQVETAARLNGAGTVASPLDIVGWPITGFTYPAGTNDAQGSVTNQTVVYGFALPFALTFSKITFFVNTADATNNSDVGLYSAAGSLVANIGAQHLATASAVTIATVQGSQTIAPGLYWMAFTSASNVLKLYGNNSQFGLGSYTNAGVTSGGALANSITAPVVSPLRQTLSFTLSV